MTTLSTEHNARWRRYGRLYEAAGYVLVGAFMLCLWPLVVGIRIEHDWRIEGNDSGLITAGAIVCQVAWWTAIALVVAVAVGGFSVRVS